MTDPKPNVKPTSPAAGVASDLAIFCLGLAVIACVLLQLPNAPSPLAVKAKWIALFVVGHASILAYLLTVVSASQNSITGPLLGIAFRTGVPMAALLLVKERLPQWSEAGFGGALVGVYLPALAIESTLAVRRITKIREQNVTPDAPEHADVSDATISGKGSPRAV